MTNSSKDIPLTVIPGPLSYIDNKPFSRSEIFIGSDQLQTEAHDSYWFLCIDRSNLKVVVNVTQSTNDTVPSEVESLAKGTDANNYILIVCTNGLRTPNLAQGKLYTFLRENGGSTMLTRMEQLGMQLGCGRWSSMTYGLVDTLGETGPGFETFVPGTPDHGTMTLKLVPIELDGKTMYSPARLTD